MSNNLANLTDAVDWARQQGYEEIALLGLSMGGATAILAVHRLPVQALVTWSAVPDMKMLFSSLFPNWQSQAETAEAIEYEGWIIKRSFWQDALQYDIQQAFSRITVPKLIIQGSADSEVFIRGLQMFRDSAQPPTDFMEIPGAGHTFQAPVYRRQVIRQTLIWLLRHL